MEKEYIYRQKKASSNLALTKKAVSTRHGNIKKSGQQIDRFQQLQNKARTGKLGFFEKKEFLKLNKQRRAGESASNELWIKTKSGKCWSRQNVTSNQINAMKGFGVRVFSSKYGCEHG